MIKTIFDIIGFIIIAIFTSLVAISCAKNGFIETIKRLIK